MPWIVSVTLTVAVPLIVVYTYIGRKYFQALLRRSAIGRRRAAVLIIALVAFVNLFPVVLLVSYLLGGRSAVGFYAGQHFIIDLLLVYPFWFGLVIAVQIALVLLLGDLLKLVLLPIYRVHRDRWRRVEAVGIFVVGFLVLVYCVVVITVNTWSLRITRYDVPLPPAARSLDGLRIVLLADVHGDWRTSADRISGVVDEVNALSPDLVFFAGDLISSGTHHIGSTAAQMGRIHAPLGKFAAVGDHDIFSSKRMVIRSLEETGYTIIEDSTLTLRIKETDVALTILTHTYRQKTPAARLSEIGSTLHGDFRILLVHQPANSVLDYAAHYRYDLLAAGHTHGGGVAVGIPGIQLLAPAHFESRIVSGRHVWNDVTVVVTNGVGFTLSPIRFHAPAEVTLLTLKAPVSSNH